MMRSTMKVCASLLGFLHGGLKVNNFAHKGSLICFHRCARCRFQLQYGLESPMQNEPILGWSADPVCKIALQHPVESQPKGIGQTGI